MAKFTSNPTTIRVTKAVPPGTAFTTFSMTSALSGNLPFCFGHAFKQGDVPAGQVALGSVQDWQCTPLNHWPDGSVKHAVIAGRADFTAGQMLNINLSSGSSPGGTVLTEAGLAAAIPNVLISVSRWRGGSAGQIRIGGRLPLRMSLWGFKSPHGTVLVKHH